LTKLDREYSPVSMKSKYPDLFQMNHLLPVFYDQNQEEQHIGKFSFKTRGDTKANTILELIKQGESPKLEYKSSLQWNIVENTINKSLRKSCLKTIVAFLNSSGGTLLIGVDNNGKTIGLEEDLKTVENSTDQFLNLLNSLIVDCIGSEYSMSVNIVIESVEDKQVCKVDVKHSLIPAYFQGEKGKEFYIRFGNTTRLLNTEEAVKYISQNWK
jgi:predicted HTH transcriptional regulator